MPNNRKIENNRRKIFPTYVTAASNGVLGSSHTSAEKKRKYFIHFKFRSRRRRKKRSPASTWKLRVKRTIAELKIIFSEKFVFKFMKILIPRRCLGKRHLRISLVQCSSSSDKERMEQMLKSTTCCNSTCGNLDKLIISDFHG